jgi:hypothetical protein
VRNFRDRVQFGLLIRMDIYARDKTGQCGPPVPPRVDVPDLGGLDVVLLASHLHAVNLELSVNWRLQDKALGE